MLHPREEGLPRQHRKPKTSMMQPCPNTLKEYKKDSDNHLLGWIGSLFVLFGYYLNANMYPSSWLVWVVGNSLVGVYCLKA